MKPVHDDDIFIYKWGNNSKRATLKGRRCRVIAWGSLNSCLVKFLDNGQQEVVSRWALGKEKPWKELQDSYRLFEDTGSDY